MALGNLENLAVWHDMAISLLRKYCEMFYNYRRKQWESDKLEFKYITDDSSYLPNVREDMPHGGYLVTLDPVRHESIYNELQGIKESIAQGKVSQWRDRIVGASLQFLFNERHFYQPLLTLVAKNVDYQVTPVPLNKGEAQLVNDLQTAWSNGVFPAGAEVFLPRVMAAPWDMTITVRPVFSATSWWQAEATRSATAGRPSTSSPCTPRWARQSACSWGQ